MYIKHNKNYDQLMFAQAYCIRIATRRSRPDLMFMKALIKVSNTFLPNSVELLLLIFYSKLYIKHNKNYDHLMFVQAYCKRIKTRRSCPD